MAAQPHQNQENSVSCRKLLPLIMVNMKNIHKLYKDFLCLASNIIKVKSVRKHLKHLWLHINQHPQKKGRVSVLNSWSVVIRGRRTIMRTLITDCMKPSRWPSG